MASALFNTRQMFPGSCPAFSAAPSSIPTSSASCSMDSGHPRFFVQPSASPTVNRIIQGPSAPIQMGMVPRTGLGRAVVAPQAAHDGYRVY